MEQIDFLTENETESKRKRKVSSIACDTCRRAKSKCSGSNPCDLCIKYKRECIYSPGKKRGPPPQSDNKKVKVDELLETNGVSVITNKYLDYFFSFMQKILGDFTCLSKNFLVPNSDSVAWHFQKYSIMSLCARSFGDITAADHYFRLAISASKDVYDLCDSNDNFQIALGFVFLSLASSSSNWKKVSHFAAVGKSFLDLCPQESLDEMQSVNRSIVSILLGELCFAAQKVDYKGLSTLLELISSQNVQIEEIQEKINLGIPKFSDYAPQFSAYPNLWLRLQFIERMALIKRVMLALFPNVKKVILSETLNEEMEGLKKETVDPKVARFVLDAIDKTTKIHYFPLSVVNSCSHRSFLHYSLGETEKAVFFAKKYLTFLSSVNEIIITVSLTVVPITFLLSKMLLEEGHIEDVNNGVRFLSKYAASFPNARTGMETLIRLKHRKFATEQDLKPSLPPNKNELTSPSESMYHIKDLSHQNDSSTMNGFSSSPISIPLSPETTFTVPSHPFLGSNHPSYSNPPPSVQHHNSEHGESSIYAPFDDPSIESVYQRIHASMLQITSNGNDILQESILEIPREDSDDNEVFEDYHSSF